MATANVIITLPEVGLEVGDGEVIHHGETPAVRARVSLVSVVTIGLGGLKGLSEAIRE